MNQRVQAVQRIFGAIVALTSLISVPPLLIAWWLDEASFQAFFDSFALTGIAGLVLWWPAVKNAGVYKGDLRANYFEWIDEGQRPLKSS